MDGIQTKTACEQLHIDLNLDTQSVSQTILLYTAHVHCRKKLCQTFNVLEKFCIKLKLICKFTFFPKCLFSHCLGPIEKEEGNGKNRNSSWGAECMNVCAIVDIYSCFWTKNIDGVSLSPKAWDNQCPGSNSQAERERVRERSPSLPLFVLWRPSRDWIIPIDMGRATHFTQSTDESAHLIQKHPHGHTSE